MGNLRKFVFRVKTLRERKNSLSSVDEKDLCKSVPICGPYRYVEQKISPMQRLISEKLRIFAVS